MKRLVVISFLGILLISFNSRPLWAGPVDILIKKLVEKKILTQSEAKYNYRRLERDAWPDFLPDSDFFGGDTNVKGHEVEFKFGLHKYVTMGLDYYHSEPIRLPAGQPELDEDLIQIDLLLKF